VDRDSGGERAAFADLARAFTPFVSRRKGVGRGDDRGVVALDCRRGASPRMADADAEDP
jgi:hypothetical protein